MSEWATTAPPGPPNTTPPPDPLPDPSTWALGCTLYACGSVIINLGQTIIRLSHTASAESELRGGRPTLKGTLLWFAGFGLFAAGDVVNLMALNMAAQSLLEALGSIQFASNLFFSVVVLKERLKRRHVLSTACIVLGNVLIVAWGDHKNQKITLLLVERFLSRPPFIAYISAVYSLSLIIAVYQYCTRKRRPPFIKDHGGGWAAAMHALSSAMVGANSVLILKALSGILSTYLANHDPSKKPPSSRLVLSLIIIGIVALAHIAFWVYRLNAALRRYEALFIIPVLQACWIIFTVTSGGIFFGEFQQLSAQQVAGFCAGLVMVLCGVLLLIPPSKRNTEVAERKRTADEGFERALLQARNLLQAGELDQEEYDSLSAVLIRSWKANRAEDAALTSPAPTVGTMVDTGGGGGDSFGAHVQLTHPAAGGLGGLGTVGRRLGEEEGVFENVQRWLDGPVKGDEDALSSVVGSLQGSLGGEESLRSPLLKEGHDLAPRSAL